MSMVKQNRNHASNSFSSDSEEDFSKDVWNKRKVKDACHSSDLDSVKSQGMTMDASRKDDWKLNAWCTVSLPNLNNLSSKEVKAKIVGANNCERQILRAKSSKANGSCLTKSPVTTKRAVNKNLRSAIKRKCSDSEDDFELLNHSASKRKFSDDSDEDFASPKNKRSPKKVLPDFYDFSCCKMKSGNLDNMPKKDSRNDFHEYELFEHKEFVPDGSTGFPEYQLDDFSFYCWRGHLCSILNWAFDEKNDVFLQGEVKTIYSDENSEGLYICTIGPINSINFTGYDNGEKALVVISTDLADYYLLKPSSNYASFYRPVLRNAYLFKYTVELLLSDEYAEYHELVEKIETIQPIGLEPFKADDLTESATFIIDEIIAYDSRATEDDEYKLSTTECIKYLADISGISEKRSKVNQNRDGRRLRNIVRREKKAPLKATTTPLIHHIMQVLEIFQGQISPKCSAAQLKEDDKDVSVNKAEMKNIIYKTPVINLQRTNIKNFLISQPNTMSIEWLDSPKTVNGKDNVHYSMILNGIKYNANDFVFFNSKSKGRSIAKIVYMFENKKKKQFHAHHFCLGSETLLGDMAAKKELYMTNVCDDLCIDTIIEKVTVIHRKPSDNWKMSGGQQFNSGYKNPDFYYYQQWYEKGVARFVDPPIDPEIANRDRFCISCYVKNLKTEEQTPVLTVDETLLWHGKEYRVGDCVYVDSGGEISKKMRDLCVPPKFNLNIDEDVYPEYYRKSRSGRSVKGQFTHVPRPFLIGRIIGFDAKRAILKSADDVEVKLQLFLRPEDTNLPIKDIYKMDYNLLFWTGSEETFSLNRIVKKCYVVYGGQLKTPNLLDDYFAGGPDRFYFLESYDRSKQATFVVANKIQDQFSKDGSKCEPYPIVSKKLKALDVFCGCGGLSDGFHQSGLTETKWAIENDAIAARAFQKNNPNATVFTGDCNILLQQMIAGKTYDDNGKKLPKKGEVEFLKGGPPCQGFSGMNRFNKGEYSLFKNSLIVTYLSYVEFLRPRFFLLENVATFCSFKKGGVLKSCLRSLREMDYQVTVGILQAGNYGVPQSRKRAFILAAGPNEKLPHFPDPIHTFSSSTLKFTIDKITYKTNIGEGNSAPFRQMTVYDGISDLAVIPEDQEREKFYGVDSQTHFQRMIRRGCEKDKIYDHTSKVPSDINKERFKYIPSVVGGDWRDLPNISVKLPVPKKPEKYHLADEYYLTEKLIYKYEDRKYGRSKTGAKRGVCPCATGENFDDHLSVAQKDTVIPWCLPHTSIKHNDWAGLFGRLNWYGFFGTTTTNPEPMGKVGSVLHPEESRVVSVRECARSQGFPDSYQFSGKILNRHKQIGNAVPPPLAKAIGLEFVKCL